jgi:hypothetical protein
MSRLFRLAGAVRRHPEVDAWLHEPADELRRIALDWFQRMRECGADVRELMHDGCPVACVEDVAFGYVNTFKAHVDVGFFNGASLSDPARLLEGAGKHMRHVKLRWAGPVNDAALTDLITAAYRDVRARLESEGA